jgi:hypothetical protein
MVMKDAYYFSHDGNARNDEKLLAVRMKYGWEGYGLFWAIIEKLRESSNYILSKDYNLISFDLRTDASTIKSIIEDFGLFLFTEDEKCFYSERLKNSMDYKESKSIKARESISKRWDKYKPDTDVIRTYNDGNTIKGKESIVKEKKESIVKDIKNPAQPTNESDLGNIFNGLLPEFSEYINARIQSNVPFKFHEEWAKRKDCYYGLVLNNQNFQKKIKNKNISEDDAKKYLAEWLKHLY